MNDKHCEKDIFLHGQLLAVVDGEYDEVETFVGMLAEASDTRVDWYYENGHSYLLFVEEGMTKKELFALLQERIPAFVLSVAETE